jgi:predicted phage terminase large subunit-like protein
MEAAAPAQRRWVPNPGPQTQVLASTAYEVLYGGAAGGGKSEAMVMDPLRYVHRREYQSILFRRTYPELEKSLIERSRRYYPAAFPRARYNDTKHVWRFPAGSLGWFSHLEHDSSVYDHQSAEYQYIGFEELTHFTEAQYRYLLSRARGAPGIPIRVRANCNPGGDGHLWVQRRWAPWLGPPPEDGEPAAYKGPCAKPGEVLWYVNENDKEVWLSREDARKLKEEWDAAPRLKKLSMPMPLSRTFIPAKLEDNPAIDPAYAARLAGLDAVQRARLRDGDWLIRPARGLYFKRGWFKFVDAAPAACWRVRYWDLAATEEGEDNQDPDWTVGVRLAMTRPVAKEPPQFFIEHVVRFRGTPAQVEATIAATAETDGREVSIGLPQDPGQAGKFQAGYLIGRLQNFIVRAEPETGDKVQRAGPISAQSEQGNVHLVRGPWNAQFIQELEEFPEGVHDDDVDALSGAHHRLVSDPPPTFGNAPPVIGRWSSGRR